MVAVALRLTIESTRKENRVIHIFRFECFQPSKYCMVTIDTLFVLLIY